MHPRILASRSDEAHTRILAAAQMLAARAGLVDELKQVTAARDRDASIARMQEREAIADLLEALAAQPAGAAGKPEAKVGGKKV